LERLTGTVEQKLDKFGDIIYAYGSERFGVEERKENELLLKCLYGSKIQGLVRKRRELRKQWHFKSI